MDTDSGEVTMDLAVIEKVYRFRNQALCIKFNIQVLNDIWRLHHISKKREQGHFIRLFRITVYSG